MYINVFARNKSTTTTTTTKSEILLQKCGGEILEIAVGFSISGMCTTKISWQH